MHILHAINVVAVFLHDGRKKAQILQEINIRRNKNIQSKIVDEQK
jgi:hypothetical protein